MKFVELLLMQDIPKLGTKGNVINVKLGYARNYLLPQGIAATITKENLRQLEIQKKRHHQMELVRKEEIKKIAKELDVSACTIEAKANEEGHLFGSVTYSKIAEQFQQMGFDIKAEDLELEDASLHPIKELGIYAIQARLHPDIIAKARVWVVNEQEEE